jgi:serine/threonine-protein kinase
MTDAYLARDAHKQPVVIRCLREDFARKHKWRKSFLQGADILGRLDHPNIVRLLETHDDFPYYMVVEYVESKSLRSLILNKDPLIDSHRLFMLRQMAAALYYLHKQGYLHLDFKPDNLLVRHDAAMVLIDFDLVTPRQKRPPRHRELDGTPFYMPPESLRSHRVNELCDIYAFGITAYEMINFHKPFQADNLKEARHAQANPSAKPIPFRSGLTNVPSALQNLIFKCLAKDPKDRYPSMSLVLKDLEDLV